MATGHWKNRIVATAEVPPTDLRQNPRNPRKHPARQRRALSSAIERVGMIQDVVVNKRTGLILDGHLRVELAIKEKQPTIPVKYVDLAPHEEALVLATFDPIGELAYLDLEEMARLNEELAPELDGPLADLVAELAPPPMPTPEPPPFDDDEEDEESAPAPDGMDPDEADNLTGESLRLPGRTVPMTHAEVKALDERYHAYLEERGMMFGFVRSLLP